MEIKKTERGFACAEFEDRYGSQCSIQASSLATEAAIWLGVNDGGHFEVIKSDYNHALHGPPSTGGRMHLTQEHVRELLPLLQRFTDTGELEGGDEPCPRPENEPLPEDLFIVFDGPPSHESGRFVEVENVLCKSVSAGQWTEREDGYWILGPFRRAPQE